MPKLNKNHTWYNANRPIKERVDALIGAMSLREKIAQTLHEAPPIPRWRSRTGATSTVALCTPICSER